MSGNNIDESGACHLSKALKVNGTLTTLNVSANDIGDSGAAHLSQALKVNGTLCSLNVTCNNIGVKGARLLSKALKVNRTLTDSGACHLIGLALQRNVDCFSAKRLVPKMKKGKHKTNRDYP